MIKRNNMHHAFCSICTDVESMSLLFWVIDYSFLLPFLALSSRSLLLSTVEFFRTCKHYRHEKKSVSE